MKLRLIGLEAAGHDLLVACGRYFQENGLSAFLDQRRVIRLTTQPFQSALTALTAQADGLLPAARDRLLLRRSLAYLFFGGPVKELQERLNRVGAAGQAPDGPLPETTQALRFLARLHQRLAGAAEQERFWRTLRDNLHAHVKELEADQQWLGPDWLITPATPLDHVGQTFSFAHLGRELMEAVLLEQENHRQLLAGLGTLDAAVDVVVIAFAVSDSFGAEGACMLAQAVRRVLQYPEANRIVAVLGLGVYNAAVNSLDGRLVGEYLRAHRDGNPFDGLILRSSAAPNLGTRCAEVLAAVAQSSDPATVQIENPDSNQIQRDFGKSVVSCGYAAQAPGAAPPAGATNPLLALYLRALADWKAAHCRPLDNTFALFSTAQRELGTLAVQRDAPWPTESDAPNWVRCLWNGAPAGDLERATARKVVVYAGHGRTFSGADLQALRARLAADFPRARTVVYKYGFETEEANGAPRPPHLALFVVDALETTALDLFRTFLARYVAVHDPAPPSVVVGTPRAAALNDRLLARALVTEPTLDAEWEPPVLPVPGGTAYPTCVRPSLLGGFDESAGTRWRATIAELVEGERLDEAMLALQAQAVHLTVRKVPVFLIREADEQRRTADWLADVLCGLNWLCNDEVQRRAVNRPLAALL
jgi:hypothetical protein